MQKKIQMQQNFSVVKADKKMSDKTILKLPIALYYLRLCETFSVNRLSMIGFAG